LSAYLNWIGLIIRGVGEIIGMRIRSQKNFVRFQIIKKPPFFSK